jgi:hypothetical protein
MRREIYHSKKKNLCDCSGGVEFHVRAFGAFARNSPPTSGLSRKDAEDTKALLRAE